MNVSLSDNIVYLGVVPIASCSTDHAIDFSHKILFKYNLYNKVLKVDLYYELILELVLEEHSIRVFHLCK